MKKIVYSKSAQKALAGMPRNWAVRIRGKIRAYAADPSSQASNVETLKGGSGVLRMRVGGWRVLMFENVVLQILDVKTRGGAYRE